MNWKDHCPIDEEEPLVQRQAWRAGWEYRMQRGVHLDASEVKPIAEIAVKEQSPAILSIWLQGYSAADSLKYD